MECPLKSRYLFLGHLYYFETFWELWTSAFPYSIYSEKFPWLQMNQLQSELRLARSLLAERDSENQRVRSTNNQVDIHLYFFSVFTTTRS